VRLCPQEYDGLEMNAVPCSRCSVGWDRKRRSCTVPTGAEHLPLVPSAEVPDCPMATKCQHQVQSKTPCAVRARGMVCQSALKYAGMSETDSFDHPQSFHANFAYPTEDGNNE
jgi:hypothetical protein